MVEEVYDELVTKPERSAGWATEARTLKAALAGSPIKLQSIPADSEIADTILRLQGPNPQAGRHGGERASLAWRSITRTAPW